MLTSRSLVRVLVILAVIGLAPLALSRLNPRPAPAPSPSPTATPATARPAQAFPPAPPGEVDEPAILGMAVPGATALHIRAVELGVAQIDGDPRPASIVAVTTTMAQAAREAHPAGPVRDAGAVVYLVLMKGSFSYDGADTFGAHLTSGQYVWSIFEPVTLVPLGTSMASHAPAIPLGRLGPVTRLL